MDSVQIKACTEKWCKTALRLYKKLSPRVMLAFFVMRGLARSTHKKLAKFSCEELAALCATALSGAMLVLSVFSKPLKKLRLIFLIMTVLSTSIFVYKLFRNTK